MRLFHRTTIDFAELIEAQDRFTDSAYNSFGTTHRGVYFCTADNHSVGNPAMFVIEADANILDVTWSDPCPPNALDWLIPAEVANRFPRSRLA